MRGTPGKIPIFFIEDMNLLACDLCFDIGNPIMDNLGGHIPTFMCSRMPHVLNTARLLFSKRFFLLLSLSVNHPRKNYWGTEQLSPLKAVFKLIFYVKWLVGDLQGILLYFLLYFPVIFHIHPPKSCHFYLLFVKSIRTFLPHPQPHHQLEKLLQEINLPQNHPVYAITELAGFTSACRVSHRETTSTLRLICHQSLRFPPQKCLQPLQELYF